MPLKRYNFFSCLQTMPVSIERLTDTAFRTRLGDGEIRARIQRSEAHQPGSSGWLVLSSGPELGDRLLQIVATSSLAVDITGIPSSDENRERLSRALTTWAEEKNLPGPIVLQPTIRSLSFDWPGFPEERTQELMELVASIFP